MKKIIWIFSFAILAMSGCTDDGLQENNTTPYEITLHLTSEKPAISGDTRSYYDATAGSIRWSATGEKMKIAFSTDNEIKEGKTFYESEATVLPDGSTATFDYTYSGAETPSGNIRFHGIYPASASPWNVLYGNITPGEVLVVVPQLQQPTTDSYDPRADVMLSISQQSYTTLTEDMEVPMIFERMVTHGKITLTNIQPPVSGAIHHSSGDISRVDLLSPPNILQAKISAPYGKTMTGIYYIDVLSKGFSDHYAKNNSNNVMLDFTGSAMGMENDVPALSSGVTPSEGTLDLWFCTQPFELSSIETLNIDLYTANGKYHRSISPRDEGIAFKQNKLSKLTVSMADATYTENILQYTNLSLPGGSGQTTFEIRTNLDCERFDFDLKEASEWLSVEEDYSFNYSQTPDADGCLTLRYIFTHKENHSTSPRSQAAELRVVRANVNSYLFYTHPLTITQQENGADVNISDFYVGEFVVMAGLRWYPVNCGFDATHPHGLLYQWGRKYGQGFEDETPAPQFFERTVTPPSDHLAEEDYPDPSPLIDPDDNTVYSYKNYKWQGNTSSYTYYSRWYSYNRSLPDGWTYVSEKVDNPCPEGWRVPTKAEWDALINCFTGIGTNSDTYFGLKYASFYEDGKSLYLPLSGYRDSYEKKYFGRNNNAFYWSSTRSTESTNRDSYYAFHTYTYPLGGWLDPTAEEAYYESKSYSVRCVQPIE